MINDYIHYFRSLAIRHKDILHNPLSDTGDAPTGEKHFTRTSYDEIIKGLRGDLFFPCMTLEPYQTETQAQSATFVMNKPSGAFMILDHPESDSYADEVKTMAKTERILYEILQQIWQDHYGKNATNCDRPFEAFYFDKLFIEPVGPLFTGQFGYRCEFNFKMRNTIDFTKPPAAETFINP